MMDDRSRLARAGAPAWASAWGEDEFGAFACFRVGAVVQRMRWIRPGTFWMGSPESEDGRFSAEGPRQRVTLTKGYWLAETPCTQALWQAVMGSNPSRFEGIETRPVENVSWEDVMLFLAALDERVPGLDAGLPREAQWEYACRADSDEARYGELEDIAWYGENSGGTTHEVALKRANAWGLYDMLGNVSEWCADAWDFGQGYESQARVDPLEVRGPTRVLRGGSWYVQARYVRAAFRYGFRPGSRYGVLGFRLAGGQGSAPSKNQPGKTR
jgi:formylglycine-generating enzyme required for sulfatase activity